MDIQITTKKSEGVERLLEVSIPVSAVRDEEEKQARRYATSVRLPGFRPGKAPAAMVRKRFKSEIRQQVLETLVQEAFKQVMEEQKLDVAAQPHVHDVKFDDNGPLTFELHLEVRPKIELARTEGFSVTRTATPVTDETVTEQLETLRDQKAVWAPVEEQPREGDRVHVLLSTPEGESTEMPEGRPYDLELGGGQAIPGVEELVMELKPGETKERVVKWPDDFPDETQRGQTKNVRVTLQEVKRKSAPALDDAFAREVGDFDSLDALREAVRKDLQEHATRDADALVRQSLLDQVAEANPFDVPPSWVSRMIDAYMQAYQIPDDQKQQFGAEFAAVAEKQVRRDMLIDAIAEQQSLNASEKDVDDRVATVAAQRNADPGQVYASLQKAGRLAEIERSITEEKVFEWLTSRNSVTNGTDK
ncbi:MAG: Trigger factor [Gemmatimonadetes bacterium]|jgi:trigger factor|nr:Trigger factor [Gemmatimonadota bacterium]